jgi:hypothetical protein
VVFGLIAMVAALAVSSSLIGATLVIVIVAERLILRRIPPVRRWLGLGPFVAGRAAESVAGGID